MAIQIAQDAHADQVLSESSFALLCGMLLDQQFPMERAFGGPAKVLDRFGTLEPAEIAAASKPARPARTPRPAPTTARPAGPRPSSTDPP